MSTFKNTPYSRFLTTLFIGGSLLSLLWSLYFARVTLIIPYQIGIREGTPQVLTAMLMNGENPYIFENQPLAYNVYSIGYSAVVLPFAMLFGNTLHIHRWVSFVFILLSTASGFGLVFHYTRKFSLALIASAFIIVGFLGRGGIGSAPTAMGNFLFWAAALFPFVLSFNRKSLAISAVLALAGFYTKAYFALAFGVVATYLFLFESKRKAVGYGAFFLGLFVISFIAMRNIFPLYFVNVIFGNISNTFRTFKHFYMQIAWLAVYFSPLILFVIFMLRKKSNNGLPQTRLAFDIRDWDRPFLDAKPDYLLYMFVFCLAVFVTILASHVGNYLSYAYELVLPVFLFWLFIQIDRRHFATPASLLILLNLFVWQFITLNPQMLSQRTSYEWERMFALINPSMKILNSAVITSRLVELGIEPVDSGQTDYFYTMKPYANLPLLGPSYEEFNNDGLEYQAAVNASIAAGEYDLIVTTKDVDTFYDLDLVEANYEMVAQFILHMQQSEQKWVVRVWEPGR